VYKSKMRVGVLLAVAVAGVVCGLSGDNSFAVGSSVADGDELDGFGDDVGSRESVQIGEDAVPEFRAGRHQLTVLFCTS